MEDKKILSSQLNILPNREKPTERQIRAICYHLWQAGYNDNIHYVKEIMTKDEAGTILSFLMKGSYKMGISQLEHLANSYR